MDRIDLGKASHMIHGPQPHQGSPACGELICDQVLALLLTAGPFEGRESLGRKGRSQCKKCSIKVTVRWLFKQQQQQQNTVKWCKLELYSCACEWATGLFLMHVKYISCCALGFRKLTSAGEDGDGY